MFSAEVVIQRQKSKKVIGKGNICLGIGPSINDLHKKINRKYKEAKNIFQS